MHRILQKERHHDGHRRSADELQEHLKPVHDPDLPTKPATLKADPLAHIKGLDLDEGMYYAANDRQLYEIILKTFAANNANCVVKIRAALATEDFETARRVAHSLKGTAGTIGAKELQKAAKAAESAMDGNHEKEAQEVLQTVEERLDPLLRQIRLELATKENL